MGILENAAEIGRLHHLCENADKSTHAADVSMCRSGTVAAGINERIESLYEGMAGSIPTSLDEVLALALLLRSQTADSIIFCEDNARRERVDRIVDNIVVGLNRLTPSDLPHWLREYLLDAENGTPTDVELIAAE